MCTSVMDAAFVWMNVAATDAAGSQDLARNSDVVLTSVPDDEAVLPASVCLGFIVCSNSVDVELQARECCTSKGDAHVMAHTSCD